MASCKFTRCHNGNCCFAGETAILGTAVFASLPELESLTFRMRWSVQVESNFRYEVIFEEVVGGSFVQNPD